MLIDCLKRPDEMFKFGGNNAKLIWILVIIITGLIGAVIYYFLIKRTDSCQDLMIGIALFASIVIVVILIASNFVTTTKTTVSIEPYPSGKLLLPTPISTPINESISEHPKNDPAIYKRLKDGATSLKVVINLKDQRRTGHGIDITSLNQTERATLIEEMKNETGIMQAGFVQFIQSRGAKIIERFWLINGLVAEVPADLIPVMANMDEVLYIQLSETDIPPPDATLPDAAIPAKPPAVQSTPGAPGFGDILSVISLLVVAMYRRKI